MSNDYYNTSHNSDPTAYNAMNNIETEKEITFIIRTIKAILNRFGYELLNRIELRNVRNGKIYK